MKTITEYREDQEKVRRKMEQELKEYAVNWFKNKPNLRFRSGNGTWFVESKYKDTNNWVKIDEKDDGRFGYHDMESDDLDFITMPYIDEYTQFNEMLEDWSCENIYLSCDINY